jgi:hypothetical protein
MTETNQWEYRVQTIGGMFGAKDDQLESLLNEWGLEGWEATQVYTSFQSNRVTIIARRPLSSENRRRSNWPGQE